MFYILCYAFPSENCAKRTAEVLMRVRAYMNMGRVGRCLTTCDLDCLAYLKTPFYIRGRDVFYIISDLITTLFINQSAKLLRHLAFYNKDLI